MKETSPLYLETTRRWIESIVIGLNLCPFAERVFSSNRIRYVVTDVSESTKLVTVLANELQRLQSESRSKVETTILIHPHTLKDFLDYNDFLGVAESLVEDLGLTGEIQVVGFHPKYQFAGTDVEAPENYTNRSPYPMMHLLREDSVSEVAGDPDELLEIPKRNVATLNRLGIEGIKKLFRSDDPG